MKINIKATNITLPESIREYLQKKIVSIERLTKNTDEDLVKVDVELGRETNHHKTGDVFRAEINCQIGKNLLRAESRQEDLAAAIDIVKDEIVKEIKSFKEKRRTKIITKARQFKGRAKGV